MVVTGARRTTVVYALAFALCACAAWLGPVPRAAACGIDPPCAQLALRGVGDERARIPANAPQLPIYGTRDLAESDLVMVEENPSGDVPFLEFRLVRSDTGYPEAIELLEPLRSGASYRLRAAFDCVDEPIEVSFDATAEAEIPDSLGATTVDLSRKEITVFDAHRCQDVSFDGLLGAVGVAWDPAAEPWRDVLEFVIQVDGQVVAGPVGWGRQEVYARCGHGGFGGLELGSREVMLTAMIPGIGVVAASPVRVEFACGEASGADPTPPIEGESEPGREDLGATADDAEADRMDPSPESEADSDLTDSASEASRPGDGEPARAAFVNPQSASCSSAGMRGRGHAEHLLHLLLLAACVLRLGGRHRGSGHD